MFADNGKKYLWPYFILCTANLLLNMLYIRVRDGVTVDLSWMKHYGIGILYARGTREWMPNCSPLWFLTSLFVALVIYELLDHMDSQDTKIILIAVGAVISYLLARQNCPKLIWNIDSALMAILFIEYGRHIRLRLCNGLGIRQKSKIIFMLALTVLYVICVKCNVETVSFDNNRYGDALFMIGGALAPVSGLLYLSRVFLNRANFFSWIGRHTIFIIGFDYFSGTVAEWILWKINLYDWVSLFALKMVLLIMGIVIWNSLVKVFPKKIQADIKFER